ncbi:sensor histidine kinase KdpD [Piscinibacter sp. HJYY11]|uniref:sensor histidine kinase n=1 Tax=Piscinibacter sp. HJYY11 TaxID=2801333 RepID=UPI00191E37A9|nr:HAMP domain-containing sensor histidine kinase [Piscinibacter sp. HJYY11]MBL0729422.1 HAMP domain-containing histidine kinase [Piscinibacter sp. HJYY11]
MVNQGTTTAPVTHSLGALRRLSHEIRTPLNAVMGFAQLLRSPDGTSHEVRERYLNQLYLAARHLCGVVESVELLSGVAFDAPCLEPTNIRDVVNEAHDILVPLLYNSGTTLHFGVCEDGCRVEADRLWLRQILLNLITNAIKYGKGRVTLSWSVDAGADGDRWVRLSVNDVGAGLESSQVARLFEPFNRLGAAATAVEGTGIGLVITRELAKGMGGSIEVSSVVGSGSSFTVLLRAMPIHSSWDEDASNRSATMPGGFGLGD